MAYTTGVYLNATKIKLGTLDISDHVSSATLTQAADELEITAMGDAARRYTAGLQTGKLDIEFFNDFGANQVSAALQSSIYQNLVVKLLPGTDGTTISALNPLYTVSILVNNLTPITGAAGEMSHPSLSFTCNTTIVQTTTGTW
jgi:hypothetical protein